MKKRRGRGESLMGSCKENLARKRFNSPRNAATPLRVCQEVSHCIFWREVKLNQGSGNRQTSVWLRRTSLATRPDLQLERDVVPARSDLGTNGSINSFRVGRLYNLVWRIVSWSR